MILIIISMYFRGNVDYNISLFKLPIFDSFGHLKLYLEHENIDITHQADKQTSICWKRRDDYNNTGFGSTLSLTSVGTRSSPGHSSGANECLCVETFNNNCLGFHNTPNTLIHELVMKLQVSLLHIQGGRNNIIWSTCRIFYLLSIFRS